jgi:hypothetical protein
VPEHLVGIGIANALFIGLKAFQQLNVVHGEKLLVFLTSHAMALAEVFLISSYAQYGAVWPLVLTVGFSAGVGSVGAIVIRKRFFRHNQL